MSSHSNNTWLDALHMDVHRRYFHCYQKKDLVLQDWLAMDRTVAANKRTLYAFMRTTLDFNVTGLIFIRFLNMVGLLVLGVFLANVHPAWRVCTSSVFSCKKSLSEIFARIRRC